MGFSTVETAFIGIGSNLGDKVVNCETAIDLIGEIPGCQLEACSGFFHTEPVGVESQDWYVNAVASLATAISARDLLAHLLAIESRMGRRRNRKWESRIIDLDILLFGQQIIQEKNLVVPHPLMHERRFVLVPMVELAPDVSHPLTGQSMSELLNLLSGTKQGIEKLRA
jgi:2-amino-4-hydroxy-6-hydroxymethyldihydropteridine diphosphokinase